MLREMEQESRKASVSKNRFTVPLTLKDTLACCGQGLLLQNLLDSIKTFQAGAVDPENELAAAIMNFAIRLATKADCKDIWRMIRVSLMRSQSICS